MAEYENSQMSLGLVRGGRDAEGVHQVQINMYRSPRCIQETINGTHQAHFAFEPGLEVNPLS